MHVLEPSLRLLAPSLCPELKLWLLPPDSEWWHASNPEALGMPYWAFAWPGGQALARWILDRSASFQGLKVVDFGSGGAIEGIAAARRGAQVQCFDLDPLANELARRNAGANGVTLSTSTEDLIGLDLDADVLLVGDACHEPSLAARVVPWLSRQAARGLEVLVGDPMRVPTAWTHVQPLARYDASFDGDPRGLTLWPTHVLRVSPAVDPVARLGT